MPDIGIGYFVIKTVHLDIIFISDIEPWRITSSIAEEQMKVIAGNRTVSCSSEIKSIRKAIHLLSPHFFWRSCSQDKEFPKQAKYSL